MMPQDRVNSRGKQVEYFGEDLGVKSKKPSAIKKIGAALLTGATAIGCSAGVAIGFTGCVVTLPLLLIGGVIGLKVGKSKGKPGDTDTKRDNRINNNTFVGLSIGSLGTFAMYAYSIDTLNKISKKSKTS